MYQFIIGLRSIFYRKSQYISLFLVCVVGIAISLTSIYLTTGMLSSLNAKAKIYYGGDLVFMRSHKNTLSIFDYDKYEAEFREIFAKDAIISSRLDYDARRASIYFEGEEAFLQTVKGVDFQKEEKIFSKFNFTEGSPQAIEKGSNGIILSEPIAKKLGIKTGDSIIFKFENRTANFDWEELLKLDAHEYTEIVEKSMTDTAEFIVKGLFQDSSIFGMYTAYVDFSFFKKISHYPENFANRICINFPNRLINDAEIASYQKAFEKKYTMFPIVTNKNQFIKLQPFFQEPTCALIPLSANLQDVKIMELAMNAIITFIIIVLTLIIIAGIGSTYRVLIMKRINEIGIYMAIGMKKGAITATLLFESLVLLALGCFFGLILSGIFCVILSSIDFSFIPSFDIFLENGNLHPVADVIKSIIVISSVVAVTLLAVLYSTLKSIKIMPVKALAVTE